MCTNFVPKSSKVPNKISHFYENVKVWELCVRGFCCRLVLVPSECTCQSHVTTHSPSAFICASRLCYKMSSAEPVRCTEGTIKFGSDPNDPSLTDLAEVATARSTSFPRPHTIQSLGYLNESLPTPTKRVKRRRNLANHDPDYVPPVKKQATTILQDTHCRESNTSRIVNDALYQTPIAKLLDEISNCRMAQMALYRIFPSHSTELAYCLLKAEHNEKLLLLRIETELRRSLCASKMSSTPNPR